MSNGHTRLDQLEEAAAARKCRIVLPRDNELQLDVDSEEQMARVRSILGDGKSKVRDLIGIKSILVTPSPSGRPGRYHVTVMLNEAVAHETHRVFLQAVLGSDPVRELLAWERISKSIAPVSVFFEKLPEQSETL